MIRPATLQDSPRIVDLMEQAFARSRYARQMGAGVDRKYALQLLHAMLMRNGFKSAEGTWCNVWVEDDKVLGYHFAIEQRIAQVGSLYEATNVHFYVGQDASPFGAIALLKSFFEWAARRDRVLEIRCDAGDLMGDEEQAAIERAYKSLGFTVAAVTLRRQMVRRMFVKEAS